MRSLKMRKLTGIVLSAALVGSMASVATVQVSAEEHQDQYRPFTTLGVIGGFNEWSDDVEMTDYDGDGIYEAEITATGEFEFKIRADGVWDYNWATYEADYDRTQNSQTNLSVSLEEGMRLIVYFDTTRVDENASANPASYVNDPNFDFNTEGFDYWPVSYVVVEDGSEESSEPEESEEDSIPENSVESYTPSGGFDGHKIGLVGDVTGWGTTGDIELTRYDENVYYAWIGTADMDYNEAQVSFKIRIDDQWNYNWGPADGDGITYGSADTVVADVSNYDGFYAYFVTSDLNYQKWQVGYCYDRSDLPQGQAKEAYKLIRMHYLREDDDYTDWSVWSWGNNVSGSRSYFTSTDGDGAYSEIPLYYETSFFGFIISTVDWGMQESANNAIYFDNTSYEEFDVYYVSGQDDYTVYRNGVLYTGEESSETSYESSEGSGTDEQYKPFTTLGVIGGFNAWADDVVMTDDDGDGIYEAEITTTGETEFKVRADNGWEYTWGEYDVNNDATWNSQNNSRVTLEEGQKLIVYFDTTKVDDNAAANPNSYVNDPDFSFNRDGYEYWPVTYNIVDDTESSDEYSEEESSYESSEGSGTDEQYKPFTTLGVIGSFNEWTDDVVMTDDDGDGIYEAEITATGEYQFEIRADGRWDYNWAGYDYDMDATLYAGNCPTVNVEEGQKLVVYFDTTKVHDNAASYADSYVNSAYFDFNRDGYRFWPMTYSVVDTQSEQYKPFTTLGVIGGFNAWAEDVEMTDDDGDGIYVAEVRVAGEYDFKVRANGEWNYTWATYETDYDRTQNSQTNLHATVGPGEKLIVYLNTTSVDYYAAMNPNSYVNDPGFDFNKDGYDYWPVSFQVEADETYVPVTNTSVIDTTKNKLNVPFNITASAKDGTEPYVFQYLYKLSSKNSWNSLSSGFTSETKKSLKPGKTGLYDIRVVAKDAKGDTETLQWNVMVYDDFTNESSVSASTINMGDTVTITGAGSGGINPYQFRYSYKRADRSTYNFLSDGFVEATSKNLRLAKAGEYDIRVEAKDVSGQSETRVFRVSVSGVLENKSYLNEAGTESVSVPVGGTVKLYGAASGGTAPYTYQYLYKLSTRGSYNKLTDGFVSDTEKSLKLAKAGTYNVKINVKDADGTVADKDLTIEVIDELRNTSSVSSESIVSGDTVTLSGAASGGTAPYTFQYLYKLASKGSYNKLTAGFVSDTSKALRLTKTGEYDVKIIAKDSTGKTADADFKVTVADEARELENTTSVSGEAFRLGDTVTISASAEGGTAPYTYQYLYKLSTKGSYNKLTDGFVEDTEKSIKLSKLGTYDIKVIVKDSAGATDEINFQATTYDKYTNISVIATGDFKVGDTLFIKGNAVCGTEPYTFAYFYKLSTKNSWNKITDGYVEETQQLLKFGKAGTYDILVSAKDASGQVEQKRFSVVVS